jgi:hypothetical protein
MPGRAELGDHGVQVADPEVQHPGLLGAAEGLAVGWERREDRWALLLPPRSLLVARRRRVDAKVVGLPAGRGAGVTSPEEQAPDAGDSFHRASDVDWWSSSEERWRSFSRSFHQTQPARQEATRQTGQRT